jgi:hypothetical protein
VAVFCFGSMGKQGGREGGGGAEDCAQW